MKGLITKETALHAEYLSRHASMQIVGGWLVPEHFGAPEQEREFLAKHAGIVDISYLQKLDCKGEINRQARPLPEGVDLWTLSPRHAFLVGHVGSAFLLPSCSIVDVTSVFAAFALGGPESAQVLRRLAALDFSERAFPLLHCAQTRAAGVHTAIRRAGNMFQLLVNRDVAESFWQSVVHAGAAPCGHAALTLTSAATL
jgi:glycine cleavage system aminomethyltransferase T